MSRRIALLALLAAMTAVTLWLLNRDDVPAPGRDGGIAADQPADRVAAPTTPHGTPTPRGAAAPATTSIAGTAPRKPGTLTLAVWNLRPRADPMPARGHIETIGGRDSAPTPVSPEPDDSPSTWRTTFGSERRDPPKRGRDASGLTADVIALQGVTHLQDVVRTYPKRDYFAIVSRQLLATVGDGKAPPTTAVAVQREEGIRVVEQDHALLYRPDGDANRDVAIQPPNDAAPARPVELESTAAAVTAIRLLIEGKPLWIASVDFSADCLDSRAPSQAPACPLHLQRREALGRWLADHRDGSLRIVLAGAGAGHLRALARDGDDVRTIAITQRSGCEASDAGVTLLREQAAPPLQADAAALHARAGGERCALLVEIKH